MNRLALCALGVLLGTATLGAQQTYSIKIKDPKQGDRRQCEAREHLQLNRKVYDVKGKLLAEQTQSNGNFAKYYEEVIEKAAGDAFPKQARRYYYQASMKIDGRDHPLVYQKKNLLVNKTRLGRYQFLLEGKEKLDDSAASLLHVEFNQKREVDLRKLMIPTTPVRPEQQWSVNVAPIARHWSTRTDVQLDLERSRGVAQLDRVYTKDGKLFGVVTFKAELPIKAMGRGRKATPTGKGSRILMNVSMDACIDGSETTGTMSARFEIKYSATAKDKEGQTTQLVSMIHGSVVKKCTELAK